MLQAAHGARRCEQQAGCPGGHRRKMCGGPQGWACELITPDRKMQREELRKR